VHRNPPTPQRMAKVMAKRTRQAAQARRRAHPSGPEVILDVVFEDGLLFLSLRNIGAQPAVNVSVHFDRPMVGVEGEREISALPLFTNLEFLAPGREIRTFLDRSASYFGRGQPERIAATIRYRDAAGRRHAAVIHHDLGIYREIGYVQKIAE
jgi:hypothetical protein